MGSTAILNMIKWVPERTCGFIIISQRTEMLNRNFDNDVIGCLFDRDTGPHNSF